MLPVRGWNYAMGLASVIYNSIQAPLKFDSQVLRFSHPIQSLKSNTLQLFHSRCHAHSLSSGLSLLIFFFNFIYEPNFWVSCLIWRRILNLQFVIIFVADILLLLSVLKELSKGTISLLQVDFFFVNELWS